MRGVPVNPYRIWRQVHPPSMGSSDQWWLEHADLAIPSGPWKRTCSGLRPNQKGPRAKFESSEPTTESALNDGSVQGFIFREPSTAAIHIALLPRSAAIIFGSAFVVPAVAETAQVSPAHGQSDLHRDRFEWTCMPGTLFESDANRCFPVSDE